MTAGGGGGGGATSFGTLPLVKLTFVTDTVPPTAAGTLPTLEPTSFEASLLVARPMKYAAAKPAAPTARAIRRMRSGLLIEGCRF